jgi:hypothetical protein
MTYTKTKLLKLIKNIFFINTLFFNFYNLYSSNYNFNNFKYDKNYFINESQNKKAFEKINEYEEKNNLPKTTFSFFLKHPQISLLLNNKNLFDFNNQNDSKLYCKLWQEEGKFTYLESHSNKNFFLNLIKKMKNLFKK